MIRTMRCMRSFQNLQEQNKDHEDRELLKAPSSARTVQILLLLLCPVRVEDTERTEGKLKAHKSCLVKQQLSWLRSSHCGLLREKVLTRSSPGMLGQPLEQQSPQETRVGV